MSILTSSARYRKYEMYTYREHVLPRNENRFIFVVGINTHVFNPKIYHATITSIERVRKRLDIPLGKKNLTRCTFAKTLLFDSFLCSFGKPT
jgi:hypothetical protein